MRINNIEDVIDEIVTYLKHRSCFTCGFQKYNYFKSLIKYKLIESDKSYIRYLFEQLIKFEIIEKRKINCHMRYRFNPDKIEDIIIKPIILNFS